MVALACHAVAVAKNLFVWLSSLKILGGLTSYSVRLYGAVYGVRYTNNIGWQRRFVYLCLYVNVYVLCTLILGEDYSILHI